MPQAAGPNPNSVLTSLKELQRIEDNRLAREQDEARNAAQADANAAAAAEQAKLDEQTRKEREAVERKQAEVAERERIEREERIRIAESERRARVEAEMALEQHRIKAEAEAKALEKKIPWGPIATVITLLVLAGGVAGFLAWQKHAESERQAAENRSLKQEREKFEKETKAQVERFQQEREALEAEKAKLTSRLAQAKSDAERDLIRKQMGAARSRARTLAGRRAAADRDRKRKAKRLRVRKTDDPLGGLGL